MRSYIEVTLRMMEHHENMLRHAVAVGSTALAAYQRAKIAECFAAIDAYTKP